MGSVIPSELVVEETPSEVRCGRNVSSPALPAARLAREEGRAEARTSICQAIRYLARTHVFKQWIVGSLDATDLLSTRWFKGCGSVTRKKHVEDKKGQVQEIEITVYGWKLRALTECENRIHLSVKLAPIQTDDNAVVV